MNPEGLLDRALATLAMLAAVRPVTGGLIGTSGSASWKRLTACGAAGVCALIACVGLLVLRSLLLGASELMIPTWMGGTLAFFGGALAMTTLLASRAVTEDAAIRQATLSLAMGVYVAAPGVALAGLGVTRLLRVWLFPVPTGLRWLRVLEGVLLLALVAIPRDALLGGLRQVVQLPQLP